MTADTPAAPAKDERVAVAKTPAPAPSVVAEVLSHFLAWMDTGNRDAVSRWDAEIIYAHVAALTAQLEAEQKRREDIDRAFVTCANDKADLTTRLSAVREVEATIEQASIDRTCNENLQVATAFLEEAARYFENRPTNGEDLAHWSNVQNAENCRKVAAHVAALTAKLEAERVDRTCNGNLQVGEDESVLAREIDVVAVAKKCVYVDDHRIAGSKPYVSEDLPQHSLKTTVERALAPFSSSVLMAALCKRDPALRSEYTTALTRETARADAAEKEAKALREALLKIKDKVCGEKHPRWSDDWAATGTRGVIADIIDRATLAQPAADGGVT